MVVAVQRVASTAAVSAADVGPLMLPQGGELGVLQVLPLAAAALWLLLVAAALALLQPAAGEVWSHLLPSVLCSWVSVSGQVVALVVVTPSVGALQGKKPKACAVSRYGGCEWQC
jgi:hypothetical protein